MFKWRYFHHPILKQSSRKISLFSEMTAPVGQKFMQRSQVPKETGAFGDGPEHPGSLFYFFIFLKEGSLPFFSMVHVPTERTGRMPFIWKASWNPSAFRRKAFFPSHSKDTKCPRNEKGCDFQRRLSSHPVPLQLH